jgi:hypothetical protein
MAIMIEITEVRVGIITPFHPKPGVGTNHGVFETKEGGTRKYI